MTDPIPESKSEAPRIHTGPEVISQFLRELELDAQLDQVVIATIKRLHATDRLNITNLIKSLEELRGNSRL
jgi:hypothetical protein